MDMRTIIQNLAIPRSHHIYVVYYLGGNTIGPIRTSFGSQYDLLRGSLCIDTQKNSMCKIF